MAKFSYKWKESKPIYTEQDKIRPVEYLGTTERLNWTEVCCQLSEIDNRIVGGHLCYVVIVLVQVYQTRIVLKELLWKFIFLL